MTAPSRASNCSLDDFTKGVAIFLAEDDEINLSIAAEGYKAAYMTFAMDAVQAGFDYVALCKRERK